MMNRIEKLSVTFDDCRSKSIDYCNEMTVKENPIFPLIPLLPSLKQLHLELTGYNIWPESIAWDQRYYRCYKEAGSEDLYRRGGLLRAGLEEAFRLGFNGQLNTLHIESTKTTLALLLSKALEDKDNKLCANLEEFSVLYCDDIAHEYYVESVDAEFVSQPPPEVEEKEIEEERVNAAIEMFVARCPKLRRLEIEPRRELHLRLHPLAAERGLEVLRIEQVYSDGSLGPLRTSILLNGLPVTKKTEIHLKLGEAVFDEDPDMASFPLSDDGKFSCSFFFICPFRPLEACHQSSVSRYPVGHQS